MGNKQGIVYNLRVWAIDHKRGLLYLQEAVRGHKDGPVKLRDSFYKQWQRIH